MSNNDLDQHTIVNVNGQIGGPEDVKISVLDRGFLFGDSIYEVTRTHNGIPLFLPEHLDRLWHSALGLGMTVAQSRQEIIVELKRTLAFLGASDAYFRLIVTRGEGDIGLDPTLAKRSNLVIIARAFRNNPDWWYEKGVNLIIPNIERNAKRATDPNIKSGNYLNNVMAYMQAKKMGAYDALMLNAQGHVTEGTTNNIWFVCDGELHTPDLSVGLLKGITREMILNLTQQIGLKVSQGAYPVDKMKTATEAFLTSSTREIVPVVKIDNWTIGNGKPGVITKKVHQAYRQFVQAHLIANKNW